ncbi:MAG: ribbon-helix-helix protein, CopG family [Nostoc desertorum CM1-VF14]|jgi:predicted DNA-binding protein|nr:ribbon-helix-helix protein, CopG family [Nostoc desertorum CM1-VF14]
MRNIGEGFAATAQNPSATRTTSGKQLSISLSDDAAKLLEFLAQTQGITQNEVLRKAIATEAYL